MTPLIDTAPHQTEITDKHGMVLILATVALSLALVIGCGIAFGWVETGCVVVALAITAGLFAIAFSAGRAGR